MSAGQELGDLIFATGLAWVPRGGGIGEVEREGWSVLFYGRQPGLLRPLVQERTCVQAVVTSEGVRVIVLGGRKGIAEDQELFRLSTQDRAPSDVAVEAVQRVSQYLAASTS